MKLYILGIFFLFVSLNGRTQLSHLPDEDLYTLGKVWGLIKYYHPAVSQGVIDWDSVLLHIKPASIDGIIDEWLKLANAAPANKANDLDYNCDSVTLRNFNLNWTGLLPLSAANKKKLTSLWQYTGNTGRYYSHPDSSRITFNAANEKTYPTFDANIKLLELFRVWNAIEYFYPYKYLLYYPWDNVLKKYIPIFKAIKSELGYQKAIMQLAAAVQDTHTDLKQGYQYAIFGDYSAPFVFQLVSDSVVVTGVKNTAYTTGINMGDIITSINGTPVATIINDRRRYFAASNNNVVVREAYNYLFSSFDSTCRIKGYHANGTPFEVVLPLIKRNFTQSGIKMVYRITGYSIKKKNITIWYGIQQQAGCNPDFV